MYLDDLIKLLEIIKINYIVILHFVYIILLVVECQAKAK